MSYIWVYSCPKCGTDIRLHQHTCKVCKIDLDWSDFREELDYE